MVDADAPILVTGAAGFIGFHVAGRLLSEGRAVVGLDNMNAYYDPALKEARLSQLKQGRESAIRLGLNDSLANDFTAGGYPGLGNRNVVDDGHRATITLTTVG